MDCCIHTSDIARRQHLWSIGCHQLFVPRHRHSMLGRRTYSVAGLQLVTKLPARSVRFLWQFSPGSETCFTRIQSALEALRLCTTQIYYWHWHHRSRWGKAAKLSTARSLTLSHHTRSLLRHWPGCFPQVHELMSSAAEMPSSAESAAFCFMSDISASSCLQAEQLQPPVGPHTPPSQQLHVSTRRPQ